MATTAKKKPSSTRASKSSLSTSANSSSTCSTSWGFCNGKATFGVILLIWGAYMLATDLGLVTQGFPVWSLLVMFAGIWLLIKSR